MADVLGTATTAAKWIPKVWSNETIVARESKLVMANLVWRFDMDVASYGDVIHVPNVSNLTGGDISTSTGLLDAEAPTEAEILITINKWKGVNMKVLDIVLAQSKYEFRKLYTEKMGYVLAKFVESDLFALAATVTNNVGTYNTAISDANLRRAVQYLDDARAPFEDRHLAIKPATKNTLLGIDKFVRYDAQGVARGPIMSGEVPGEIYGTQVHVSPEVYKTGSNTSNVMFHRSAFGLAIQKDVKMEEFARIGWVDAFGGSELYGVQLMRDDQSCEVRS